MKKLISFLIIIFLSLAFFQCTEGSTEIVKEENSCDSLNVYRSFNWLKIDGLGKLEKEHNESKYVEICFNDEKRECTFYSKQKKLLSVSFQSENEKWSSESLFTFSQIFMGEHIINLSEETLTVFEFKYFPDSKDSYVLNRMLILNHDSLLHYRTWSPHFEEYGGLRQNYSDLLNSYDFPEFLLSNKIMVSEGEITTFNATTRTIKFNYKDSINETYKQMDICKYSDLRNYKIFDTVCTITPTLGEEEMGWHIMHLITSEEERTKHLRMK